MNDHGWVFFFNLCVLSIIHDYPLSILLDLKPDYDVDYEEEEMNCSLSETLSKGQVSYSNGGMKGSVLTYTCPDNFTPYPVSQRVCGADGEWTSMRQPGGRALSRAVCKGV